MKIDDPVQRAERLRQVGELLKNFDLTLKEIGERVGLSRERIRQIAVKYFPEFPKRPKGYAAPKKDYGRYDALFLDPSKSNEEIAAQVKTSAASVNILRYEALRRNGLLPPLVFRRRITAILRESGAKWCRDCRMVKDLALFSPGARGKEGGPCTACATVRQRRNYHTNPKVKEYYKRYQKEHPEQTTEYRKRFNQRHPDKVREGQRRRWARRKALGAHLREAEGKPAEGQKEAQP